MSAEAPIGLGNSVSVTTGSCGDASPAGRVCAVVVTFNRKSLLRNCLSSLLMQSRKVEEIVVVNNASGDGTGEMLAQEFPVLRTLNLDRNVGGAGGFREGMRWAYEAGFDWMWVMDDDIEVEPGALAVMLDHRQISDFIHVRKSTVAGPFVWEGLWDLAGPYAVRYREDLSFKNGKEWTVVPFGNFEGALIHRRVVSAIGYPDERFFIIGDDTIYGFLASLHTNVIYVNHFGIRRCLPPGRIPDRLVYYCTIRNRFLTYEHLRHLGVPLSAGLFRIHTLHDAAPYLKRIVWEDPSGNRLRNLLAVCAGLRDGIAGRFGPPPWLRSGIGR